MLFQVHIEFHSEVEITSRARYKQLSQTQLLGLQQYTKGNSMDIFLLVVQMLWDPGGLSYTARSSFPIRLYPLSSQLFLVILVLNLAP